MSDAHVCVCANVAQEIEGMKTALELSEQRVKELEGVVAKRDVRLPACLLSIPCNPASSDLAAFLRVFAPLQTQLSKSEKDMSEQRDDFTQVLQ